MKRALAPVFAILVLLAGTALFGQEQTSAIEGTVVDQSGAAMAGVTVEAVSNKGVRFSTQSDSSGRYRFPSVPPGTYTLMGTLSGMETATIRNVEARLSESPKIELRMRVGAVAEAMTVTAEAPLVDVTSSAAATSIRAESIEQLPRGRDFASVVTFAPSANQNSKTGGISIDGASGAENRYIMDGVDTTNPQTGVQGKTLVTDFVDEVQVKSAGYQAEFGGSTGGVINVITKTGTNDFKGTAGAVYHDRSWGGSPRPVLQINLASNGFEQFEPREDEESILEPAFTLGGPILRDRVWFWGGYEPWMTSTTRTIDFFNSNGSIRTTRSFDQDIRRDNWIANLSGSAGSKFLYKATYNSSGYTTKNLLPNVNGRGSENADYSPDDKFENWTASGYADYVATPQWFFSARGGRFNRNYTQQGISDEVRVVFTSGSPGQFPGVPAELVKPQGYSNIPTNTASQRDAYIRDNLNFDASWFPEFAGAHRFKAGIQLDNITNQVLRGQQNYLVTAYWNGVCDQCQAGNKGTFGSAGVYIFQTTGDVKSENTGFFIQDSWTTLNDRLTLNIGVRTEQELVPAYNFDQGVTTTGMHAIKFEYGDKIAPRLGFSYDLFGNGRSKAYGSYGKFYDIMKMEMPRGSFGGDKWIYWQFNLESTDWSQWFNCTNVTNNPTVKPSCPGMVLQGGVDLRHASNSAALPLVDPDLKPMESEEFSLGFQQEMTRNTALGFRYVNKRLIRGIEDVGVRVFHADGTEAEEFFIANPGFGVAQKILGTSCPTCPAMPKITRDYDGYELEFTRRLANRWSLHASYLYSRLRGNYSGLANSDEVTANPGTARTSPNVNRIFDSLFMLFDQEGSEVEGPLGGDRPHQAKAQITYAFPFGTNVGLSEYFYSGTPTTTEMRFQSAPIFPFGRNDLGRTPNVTQTDLNLTHDFRIGKFAVQLGAIVLNLFDEREVLNVYPIWSTTSLLLRDLSACGTGPVTVEACGPASSTPIIGGSTAGAARNAAQAAAFFAGFDAQRQRDRQLALGTRTATFPDVRYGQPNDYQSPREVRVFVKFLF
jgi:hypothetical protein